MIDVDSVALATRPQTVSLESGGSAGAPPVDWRGRLSMGIWLTDLLMLAVATYGAEGLWFSSLNAGVITRDDSAVGEFSYSLMSLVLLLSWMWALALNGSRLDRVVGSGSTEYRRVVEASLHLFGAVAIVAFLLRVDVARGYLFVSLPLGVVTLIVSRWCWRQWLVRQRALGRYNARVVLVGSSRSVVQIARELRRAPSAGYQVVGACLPPGDDHAHLVGAGIPLLGAIDDLKRALEDANADTVAVTSTDDLPPDEVKRISWQLEPGRHHLVLAPSIVDIAGPRIHTRRVAGLPLIHVETPRLNRSQIIAKRMLDLLASLLGVVAISPVLLVLAAVVKASSPGPVFFRQTRIGLNGREFVMFKFRSMVTDAEAQLPTLVSGTRDSGNEILFKMRDDPRVTRPGRFMRRHSLDELPQLLNVISGSMSLVGPRPPLGAEVEQYDSHVNRRFMMKPGITGLWQVSGRSTLSWDETVRLDLSYVENYSLIGDLAILAKTFGAVLSPGDSAH